MSELEDSLLFQIRVAGLLEPRGQYCLPGRRFRWDMAWETCRLLVDIQGGGFLRGRHHRPQGYRADCIKANLAVLAGWRVLRVTGDMISDGEALRVITEALVVGGEP